MDFAVGASKVVKSISDKAGSVLVFRGTVSWDADRVSTIFENLRFSPAAPEEGLESFLFREIRSQPCWTLLRQELGLRRMTGSVSVHEVATTRSQASPGLEKRRSARDRRSGGISRG